MLLTGFVGAALARWQGLATLRKVQTDMAGGRVPGEALVDGLLILVAGAVLLTPGLLTDAAGFLLLIPPTRALVRRALVDTFKSRVQMGGPTTFDARWSPGDDRDGPPTIDV